ncbi:MAG: NAD-binding protein [Candidatus Sumerlaeia bacterium]
MAKSFLVIGLGTFGMQTARALYRKGAEVLAVDIREGEVDEIRDDVTQSVCADATNTRAMEQIGAYSTDAAVVAIRRRFDTTVLVVYGLVQKGFKEIFVRVDSDKEAAAIRAVGASQVIFPERDMAERLANRMMMSDLAEQIPLGDNVGIIELPCPESLIGKSLSELNFRKKYGIMVIALKVASAQEEEPHVDVSPDPEKSLEKFQTLVLLGDSTRLARFKESVQKEDESVQKEDEAE